MYETLVPSATERWAWCCPHCSKLVAVRSCPLAMATRTTLQWIRMASYAGCSARRAGLFAAPWCSLRPDTPTRYTGRKHRTYHEHEIDYFGVYCPDTDGVYLVPMEDVGPHTSAYLRVEPARNNQTKGVRWAVDYEVMPK
jgi:hypothetical protein